MTEVTDAARLKVERVRAALGTMTPYALRRPQDRPTRLLVLEDDPIDRRAVKRALSGLEQGASIFETDTIEHARQAARSAYFDVAILDYDLPDGNSLDILHLLNELHVPSIMVTGAGNERLAATLLSEGAAAYVIKDVAGNYLTILPEKVKKAKERALLERERDELLDRMAEMLETITALKGLIPVCSVCRKIRNPEGNWENFEVVVAKTFTTEFTHGLCPHCLQNQLDEYGLNHEK